MMSTRGLIRIWALVNLLFSAAVSLTAHAGVVYLSCECETEHLWNFDDTSAELNLQENIEVVSYDEVIMSGATDSDPTFHVTKTVTNNSGLKWTAYELVPSGPDVTFDYINAPSSSHFLNTNEQVMKLMFYAPDPVPNGDTVTLDFDVNVWPCFAERPERKNRLTLFGPVRNSSGRGKLRYVEENGDTTKLMSRAVVISCVSGSNIVRNKVLKLTVL